MLFDRRSLIGVLAITVAACGGSGGYGGGGGVTNPPPPPAPGTVNATPNLAFTPRTVTIHAGESVTFEFGSIGHNVTFDAAAAGTPADIGGINSNTNVQRTFAVAGTYQYHCTIHPGMNGTVVVQ